MGEYPCAAMSRYQLQSQRHRYDRMPEPYPRDAARVKSRRPAGPRGHRCQLTEGSPLWVGGVSGRHHAVVSSLPVRLDDDALVFAHKFDFEIEVGPECWYRAFQRQHESTDLPLRRQWAMR